MLSAEELARYRSDGFLTLPGFVSQAVCDELLSRADELCAEFDPSSAVSVFSTKNQAQKIDDYFLTSGDKIRFFIEEGAVSPDGRLCREPARSINKIGHALHDLDPIFSRFSRTPEVAAVVADLGVTQPLLVQSMLIFKQPGIGGEVACHQDATFLYTDPPSVVGLWFALEDATLENGCMWAIPGGHEDGLRARFVRDREGGVRMRVQDPRPFPTEREVPLVAPKGTLIVLHGLLPHRSPANTSPRSRRAYAVHVIDGAAVYAEDNWLKRAGDMPLRGFGDHALVGALAADRSAP